jgi:hypothetical protein
MTTPISTKLTALALALLMNSVLLAGITLLFDAPQLEPSALVAMAAA